MSEVMKQFKKCLHFFSIYAMLGGDLYESLERDVRLISSEPEHLIFSREPSRAEFLTHLGQVSGASCN